MFLPDSSDDSFGSVSTSVSSSDDESGKYDERAFLRDGIELPEDFKALRFFLGEFKLFFVVCAVGKNCFTKFSKQHLNQRKIIQFI